jgi:lipooligosaccharide transport system permease protein
VLVAIGFGLGAYIDSVAGMSYAEFLAPGLVASYAMLFTPLGPEEIVVGEVMWSATRAVLSGPAVLVVAAMFGLVDSPLAVLAIPVAYLIGVTFGSISMIVTAAVSTLGAMNNFYTLFILPMRYVSGVFFPLDRVPEAVRVAAWALLLTPGAALTRGLVAGDLSCLMLLWVLELVAFSVVALWLASVLMRRQLIK